jgi:hypothetical protein
MVKERIIKFAKSKQEYRNCIYVEVIIWKETLTGTNKVKIKSFG